MANGTRPPLHPCPSPVPLKPGRTLYVHEDAPLQLTIFVGKEGRPCLERATSSSLQPWPNLFYSIPTLSSVPSLPIMVRRSDPTMLTKLLVMNFWEY